MRLRYLLLVLTAFMLNSCALNNTATPLPTVALNAPAAKATTPVSSTTGRGTPAASGIVVPEQDAQLAFTVSGKLKTVNFKEGDQVSAGQLLAELDNSTNQRELDQAQRNLKELTSPASQAGAEQALAVAQQALKDQQDKFDAQFYRRASDTLIQKTQSQIELAKRTLALATDTYRSVARLDNDNYRKASAVLAMSNAQLNLNDLQMKLNWYTGKPTDIDAALANAKLDVAKTSVQEAQWYLAVLKGGNIPPEATGANLANLEAAQAAVADAQQRLDLNRLVSPISGIVVKSNGIAGEIASPGELIFEISDVMHLHIETTDLSERDVPNVKLGQTVMVNIKALNIQATGKVISISPVADTVGGDVVYKTKIALDSPPDGLRAGMSVDVQYETGQ